MRTLLNPADEPAHDVFVEKKSEFIGDACHVDSLEDALAFVETVRERHPKARHVAYAAIVTGDDGRVMERMRDDGEPSGTAGKPILDVLRANELTDCVIAVTRYFGGILLGSGGLIRAYSTGASIAVKAADVAQIVVCARYAVPLDYSQLGPMRHLVEVMGAVEESADFSDHVVLIVLVRDDARESFEHRVREQFSATVTPEYVGRCHRAMR